MVLSVHEQTQLSRRGAALPLDEPFVVLHAGEGFIDTGPDPPAVGVVSFFAGQHGSSGAFAVRDDEARVDVGAVGEHGTAAQVARPESRQTLAWQGVVTLANRI